MAVRSNGEILLKPPDESTELVDAFKPSNKIQNFTSKKNPKKEDPVNLDGINEDELQTLLNEAIQYKTPRDAEQSSDLFRSLLKETTQESGEESPPAIFPVIANPSSKKRRNKHSASREFNATLAASRTQGGSLQNLNELDDLSGYQCSGGPGGRRKGKRRGEGSGSSTPNVSARKREGGSLPCGVDRGGLEEDRSAVLRSLTEAKSSRKKKELSKSHSISESRMPAILVEPSAPPPDNDIKMVDMRQKADFVSINMEERCIGDDEGRIDSWNLRHEHFGSHDCVDAKPLLERQMSDDRRTEIVDFDCSDDERAVDSAMDPKTVDQLSKLRMNDQTSYGTMSSGYRRREEVDGEVEYPLLQTRLGYQQLPEHDDGDSGSSFLDNTAVGSCIGQSDNPMQYVSSDNGRRTSPNAIGFYNERKIEENGTSPPSSERQLHYTVGNRSTFTVGSTIQGPNSNRGKKNRNKTATEKVIRAEDMEDYRGNLEVDDLLDFIEGGIGPKKNDKKGNGKEKNGKGKKKLETGEKLTNGVLSDGEQKDNKKKSRAKSENSAVGIVKSDKKIRSSSLEDTSRSNAENNKSQDNDSDISDSPHSQLSKSTSNDSDKFKTPVGGEQSPVEHHYDYVTFQTEFVPVVVEESEFRTVTKKSRKKRKSPVRPEKNFANRRTNIHFEEARRPAHGANDDILLLYRNQRKRSGERRMSSSSVISGHSGYDSDKDSVHSLPCSSTTSRVTLKPVSTSSGSTPQASYADITRKLRGEEMDKSPNPKSSQLETSKAVISSKSKTSPPGDILGPTDISVDFGSPELPKPKAELVKQAVVVNFPVEICDFPPLNDELIQMTNNSVMLITPESKPSVNSSPEPPKLKESEQKEQKTSDKSLAPQEQKPEISFDKASVKETNVEPLPATTVAPEKTEAPKLKKNPKQLKPEDEKRSLPPMFVIESVTSTPVPNEGLTFGFEINEELLKDRSVKVNKTRKNSLNEKSKLEEKSQERTGMRKVASDKDFAAYYKESLKLDSSKFNFKDIVAYVGREWSFLERKRQGKNNIFYDCNRISS